jgi:hypothetical protein
MFRGCSPSVDSPMLGIGSLNPLRTIDFNERRESESNIAGKKKPKSGREVHVKNSITSHINPLDGHWTQPSNKP